MSAVEWRVLRDRDEGPMPGSADVLCTIAAKDRTEAQRLAELAFPLERLAIVPAEQWPLTR